MMPLIDNDEVIATPRSGVGLEIPLTPTSISLSPDDDHRTPSPSGPLTPTPDSRARSVTNNLDLELDSFIPSKIIPRKTEVVVEEEEEKEVAEQLADLEENDQVDVADEHLEAIETPPASPRGDTIESYIIPSPPPQHSAKAPISRPKRPDRPSSAELPKELKGTAAQQPVLSSSAPSSEHEHKRTKSSGNNPDSVSHSKPIIHKRTRSSSSTPNETKQQQAESTELPNLPPSKIMQNLARTVSNLPAFKAAAAEGNAPEIDSPHRISTPPVARAVQSANNAVDRKMLS